MSHDYSTEDQKTMNSIVAKVLDHYFTSGQSLVVKSEKYSEALQEERATFVSIKKKGELRGCIGSLQPHRPLIQDLANNTYSAACLDARFFPLQFGERSDLDWEISVLSLAESMTFSSESDFMDQLRPGVDGLIFAEGVHVSTLLPSVWEKLSDPIDFMQQLKEKAGLDKNYWSDSVKILRYTTSIYTGKF